MVSVGAGLTESADAFSIITVRLLVGQSPANAQHFAGKTIDEPRQIRFA
jgi:hypothetical protein